MTVPTSRAIPVALAALTALILSIAPAAAQPKPQAKPSAETPKTETPKPPEAVAPAAEGPKASETLKGPAAPVGEWDLRAVKAQDGQFSYCVTQTKFDSGHVLVIARTRTGEVNVALGIPGARLPADERWSVKLSVDDKATRDKAATAAQADLLVVPLGKDEEIYGLLGTGRQLNIQSNTDRIAFQLKGTKKVLGDLKSCAEKAGAGFENKAAAAAPARPPFPEALTAVLAAAGFRELQPVSFDGVPVNDRPADFAWRNGPLFGGVRERQVISDSTLAELATEYSNELKDRCPGETAVALGDAETLPGLTLRTGSVDCAMKDGGLHIALLYYMNDARLFTVFFHEGPAADKEAATRARDSIAGVIRTVAGRGAKPPAK